MPSKINYLRENFRLICNQLNWMKDRLKSGVFEKKSRVKSFLIRSECVRLWTQAHHLIRHSFIQWILKCFLFHRKKNTENVSILSLIYNWNSCEGNPFRSRSSQMKNILTVNKRTEFIFNYFFCAPLLFIHLLEVERLSIYSFIQFFFRWLSLCLIRLRSSSFWKWSSSRGVLDLVLRFWKDLQFLLNSTGSLILANTGLDFQTEHSIQKKTEDSLRIIGNQFLFFILSWESFCSYFWSFLILSSIWHNIQAFDWLGIAGIVWEQIWHDFHIQCIINCSEKKWSIPFITNFWFSSSEINIKFLFLFLVRNFWNEFLFFLYEKSDNNF